MTTDTTTALTGIIRGRTIELDAATGIPEGEAVRVILHPQADATYPVEELRKILDETFGAFEDQADELDEFDRMTQYLRHMERREIDG